MSVVNILDNCTFICALVRFFFKKNEEELSVTCFHSATWVTAPPTVNLEILMFQVPDLLPHRKCPLNSDGQVGRAKKPGQPGVPDPEWLIRLSALCESCVIHWLANFSLSICWFFFFFNIFQIPHIFQLSPAASSEAKKTFAFGSDVLQAAKCKIRVHAVTHCQTH